jgi:hypothetical protein
MQINTALQSKNRCAYPVGLGVLALLSVLFSHLALTDIWHASEPNLCTAWLVVRFSAVVIIAFIGAVFNLLAFFNKFTKES